MKVLNGSLALILGAVFLGQGVGELQAQQEATQTVVSSDEGKETSCAFPGGQVALLSYLGKNLRYPKAAVKKKLEGYVYVSFVVEKTGELTEIKVSCSGSPELDKEAVRVVSKMPKWIPGTKDGKPVRQRMILPVVFKLS